MRLTLTTSMLLIISGVLHAQITPLPPGIEGGTLNQRDAEHLKANREASKEPTRDVAVFIGDRVIPQIADGDFWQTSMTFVNLEDFTVNFTLFFFADNGNDLYLPIVGLGSSRGIKITLKTTESITIDTTGTSPSLAQGWAYFITEKSSDSIGGLTIFKQSVPNRQPSEAVVPVVSRFDDHFVLLFDNTNWVTAMAVANPSSTTVLVPMNIRDEAGAIQQQQFMTLKPYEHRAFVIPEEYSITAGRRGKIEFMTTGFGVGVLGLRFHPLGSFTSFHVLSNIKWLLN